MRIGKLLLSLALLAGAAPVAAQVDTVRATSDTVRARILDHTFRNPSREFVRVRLEAGQTYRAELTGDRVRLEVHPLQSGVKAVDLAQLGEPEARPVAYGIRPRATGEYEIRVLVPGNHAVRLTIDRKS